jgi:hypothetical protein
MTTDTERSWIEDGEKYGLVGLDVNLKGVVAPEQVTPNLWALSDASFNVPVHWKEWLGSVRAEEVEACNLFLLSKGISSVPEILDAENKKLQQNAWTFYVGLLLSSTFAPVHRPVLLTGSRRGGEIDIRQQQDLDSPIPSVIRPYPPVVPADVRHAAHLGENLEALAVAPIAGKHWRLFRTLHIYTTARTTPEIVDRIHQYCRCIDGLIVPEIGKTKQQFKSRTELFVGPGYHDLMGELYDIRSAVEHLHEYRYLEKFDRTIRLELVKNEAIVEHIARTTLARVIGDAKLWPHFANTTALERFWALNAQERRAIWGNPLDPKAAVVDFDPDFINDGELGAK